LLKFYAGIVSFSKLGAANASSHGLNGVLDLNKLNEHYRQIK